MPKYRSALFVFFVGFALGLSVYAASRLFVRSVLTAEATAAAEELAGRLATGQPIEATGALSMVSRYTRLDANGGIVESATVGNTARSGPGEELAAAQAAAVEAARSGDTIVTHAPLLPSLLGLTEPVVRNVGVPIVSDGQTIGSALVEVDQTATLPNLSEAFSFVGIVAVGLAVLALVLIGFALRRGERRASHSARQPLDPLTGVPTRQGFEAALGNAVDRAAVREQQIGLMIIDLDDFRAVNHIWGHAAGDAVLRMAAERLRSFASGPAGLARISGDHFALLVEGDANPLSLGQWTEKVHAALRAPYDVAGSSIFVGASIGAALFPVNADNPDMLFRAADTALSKAKGNRSEPIAFFDTDMKRKLQRRAVLERDMRHALEREEFIVFYQPQLELASGQLRGYEALLRWERPGEGILPTTEFLSVAEETGLIRPLGEWVLRKACRDAAAWPGSETVAVNFSAAQFRFQNVEATVAAALADSGLPAHRLEIEVPETLFLAGAADVMETLARVRALGVRIAMDNFGGGYSGLSSLAQFPFDKIKIDRSFVDQLGEDADVAAIVASIVGLGRALTLDITAEGVETNEQVTLLKAAGCKIVQGYLFGVPQPIATPPELVEAGGVEAEPPSAALG
jgi:diguanylate cyclase (GGDEF)-like protein